MRAFVTVSSLAIAAALAAGFATTAHAQDSAAAPATPAPAAAAPAAAEQSGVGEIVVTAQFAKQNLQDTPLAITAATAEMMDARSQTNVTDVANTAPSVNLSTGGQGGGSQTAAVSIRGIGTTDFQFPVEPGVGIYIDDVYYGVSFGSSFDLVDLDRVEILRGPQGTLSGKNSIGGSIKLFSRLPGADPDAYIEGTYGSFNRLSVKAGTNFTLVDDKLYARLTGLARHVDGYVDRIDYGCQTGKPVPGGNFATASNHCIIGTEGGQDIYAARGALRWLVSDNIENNLIVDFTEDRSEASPMKAILLPDFGDGNNYITGPEDYTNYGTYTGHPGQPTQYTVPAISHLQSWGIANTLDVHLSDALDLKSITAFRSTKGQNGWEGDGSPQSIFTNFNTFDHKQFTQELRLSANIGDIADVTAGAYYYDASSHIGGRINVEIVALEFGFNDPFKQTSKSAFVHAVLHPTDRLNITGGLRYTKEDKDYTFTRYAADPAIPAAPFLVALDGVHQSFSADRWDYRLALDYEVADNVRPYVQVSTGFKGGGVNPRPFLVPQAITFQPEYVTSYEAGLKTLLFDHKLRLNLAAYHTDYTNYQAQLLTCPALSFGIDNFCAATQNIGDVKIDGAEAEFNAEPIQGLTIDGSASYVDFRFSKITNVDAGLTLDTRPQFTPKWKFNLGVQYRIDLAQSGSITPRLDWTYRSSIESNAINNQPHYTMGHVDELGLLNGRITYQTDNKNWELALAVTNITDKFYYVNKYDREAGFNAVFGQPGRPREWQVSVKRTF